MRRYAPQNDQWDRIAPLLPGKSGDVGGAAKDNRLFVASRALSLPRGYPRGAICPRGLAMSAGSTPAKRAGPQGGLDPCFQCNVLIFRIS